MPHSAPQRLHGFTLLELLLVLIIMASITFLAINRYQLYAREKDIAAIKQNVNLLFNATNAYYHLCCSNSNGIRNYPGCTPCGDKKFCVNTAALSKANLMPTLVTTKNPPAINYTVNATWFGQTANTKNIYTLSTTVDLPDVNSAALPWYQQILNALSIQGKNTLVWQQFPSYSIPTTSSGLWIAGTGLRQFKAIVTSQQPSTEDTCAY